MDYGGVMTAPLFVDVGAVNSLSLSAIVPIAGEGVDLAGSIAIQTLNNWGGTGDEDYTWDGEKWIDTNTGSPVTDVSFTAGKGLWVYNFTGEDVKFRSAGQVNEADIVIPLDLDYGGVGVVNAFPVEVPLSSFVLEADESVDLAGSIAIQTLNNWGGTGDEDYTWDGAQWIDTNTGVAVQNVKFSGGKGLWVYNFTGEAVSMRIPAPEL